MRLEQISIEQAVGTILVHNVPDQTGRKVLSKGRLLRPEDVQTLRDLHRDTVYVARLGAGDVREDEAAARLAGGGLAGRGIEASKPSGGRVNFYAKERGFLSVNSESLRALNAWAGITLATRPPFSTLAPRKMVATLKTIGLALPEKTLLEARTLFEQAGPILNVAPVARARVAVILTASEQGRSRVAEIFAAPIRERIEANGGEVLFEESVLEEEEAIAAALKEALERDRADLVILAGETSIMDAEDVTPRGILRASGAIELYGAPVEPGNLLLLAYRGNVPIIGAPGCIKSRETNVVDLILPRLMAGERVTRAHVMALAEGGLLAG